MSEREIVGMATRGNGGCVEAKRAGEGEGEGEGETLHDLGCKETKEENAYIKRRRSN